MENINDKTEGFGNIEKENLKKKKLIVSRKTTAMETLDQRKQRTSQVGARRERQTPDHQQRKRIQNCDNNVQELETQSKYQT